MKRATTVYLYELAWILPSIAIPVGMLAALIVTAFGAGIHVPGEEGRGGGAGGGDAARHDGPLRPAGRRRGRSRPVRGPDGGRHLVLHSQRDPRARRLNGHLRGDE